METTLIFMALGMLIGFLAGPLPLWRAMAIVAVALLFAVVGVYHGMQ